VRAFGDYLSFQNEKAESTSKKDVFREMLMPQVVRIVTDLFRALGKDPSSFAQEAPAHEPVSVSGEEVGGNGHVSSGKLKRFGLDFLVDRDLRVWLIEINVLKGGLKGYGLAAAHGAGGAMKLEMTRRLVAEEDKLKLALMHPLKQQRWRSSEATHEALKGHTGGGATASSLKDGQLPTSFVRAV
jgi:hypothetical protein